MTDLSAVEKLIAEAPVVDLGYEMRHLAPLMVAELRAREDLDALLQGPGATTAVPTSIGNARARVAAARRERNAYIAENLEVE